MSKTPQKPNKSEEALKEEQRAKVLKITSIIFIIVLLSQVILTITTEDISGLGIFFIISFVIVFFHCVEKTRNFLLKIYSENYLDIALMIWLFIFGALTLYTLLFMISALT